MNALILLQRVIDRLNAAVGAANAVLILPLICVVAFEVVMRYGFNAPTTWAFEATTLLYGVHFALAFGEAHKNNSHVAIDILEMALPPRPQLILRLIGHVLIFVPTTALLAIWSVNLALVSWQQWEHASTSWSPPIYPFKTLLSLGFILLFLQGVAKLIADIRALRGDPAPSGPA